MSLVNSILVFLIILGIFFAPAGSNVPLMGAILAIFIFFKEFEERIEEMYKDLKEKIAKAK
ncbi:MAG: hypothetical protein ACOC56_04100 [Atribacterota bacterium]